MQESCPLCQNSAQMTPPRSVTDEIWDVACTFCGNYKLHHLLLGQDVGTTHLAHLIMGAVRLESDRGGQALVRPDTLQQLEDEGRRHDRPLEKIDRLLLLVERKQDHADQFASLDRSD